MSFTDRERGLWRGIVASKPIGFFDAGSLILLGRYVRMACWVEVLENELIGQPALLPRSAGIESRLVKANGCLAQLANKLRLSVEASVDRRSGMLTEKPSGKDGDESEDVLLGGHGEWQKNIVAFPS